MSWYAGASSKTTATRRTRYSRAEVLRGLAVTSSSVLLAGSGLVGAPLLGGPRLALADEAGSSAPRVQDDFYAAVNHDLLEQWEIPADKPYVSTIGQISEEVMARIGELARTAAEEAASSGEASGDVRNVGAFYATGTDEQARNAGGWGPTITEYLGQVDAVETVEELLDVALRFARSWGMYSLLGLAPGPDPQDSSGFVLYFVATDTGPDRGVWMSDDEVSRAAVEAHRQLIIDLWRCSGADEATAGDIADQVMSLQRSIVEASLTTSELYDPSLTTNVFSADDLCTALDDLVTTDQLEEIFGSAVNGPIIVSDVGSMNALAAHLTQDNLEMLKAHVKTCAMRDVCRFASMEANAVWQDYQQTVSGTEEQQTLERQVLEHILTLLPHEIGRIYCDEYLTAQARQDVADIIDRVIETYDRRIGALDWMGDATKEAAQRKLRAITAYVGCPDEWPQDYYDLAMLPPDEGGLFVENFMALQAASSQYSYRAIEDPDDYVRPWAMSPCQTNAYYQPDANSISILAGIMLEPIYSADASRAQNLGSIGAVIAHEITHAFDMGGSQYDEHGNLVNWWTEEDSLGFAELAQRVVDYYGGYEIEGTPVDGELTLSENIADLGAVACVTQIAQEDGLDLMEVYESWARVWATKMTHEYEMQTLMVDTHAPSSVRTNATLSATDAFYDVAGVEEGDGMYVPPQDRPAIW